MVDSDILIWHFRGLPEISAQVIKLVDKGILYTSPVVVAEIFAGARKNEEVIINNLLTSIKIIEIGKEIGKATGQYLNKYSKSHNLEMPDALIAASSVFSKMKLWTLNKKHYPMLQKNEFYEF